MSLITMFFDSDDDRPYRKAIIDAKDRGFFESLGAVRKPDLLSDIPPQEQADPDKGWGKFGSYEWHRNSINDLKGNTAVYEYVLELTGIKIEKKGFPKHVKKKALHVIKEFINGKST